MKKIMIYAMLLVVSATSFSQSITPEQTLTREDYLKKSKKQKTAAWILAGGGMGLMVAAAATGAKAYANTLALQGNSGVNTSTTLFVIGGITTLSSIPLFIASGRNKRKGMSLSFKNETAPQIQKNSFVYRSFPSLTLKISL